MTISKYVIHADTRENFFVLQIPKGVQAHKQVAEFGANAQYHCRMLDNDDAWIVEMEDPGPASDAGTLLVAYPMHQPKLYGSSSTWNEQRIEHGRELIRWWIAAGRCQAEL